MNIVACNLKYTTHHEAAHLELSVIVIVIVGFDVPLSTLYVIRQPDVVGRLKLYCCPFFCQCRRRAEDVHQIYTADCSKFGEVR